MKSVSLIAYPRTARKRLQVKKLRTLGRVPAVIYGQRRPGSQSLEVDAEKMGDLMHHSASDNVLVDLQIEGDASPNRLALVQSVQHHALSGHILHVDFHEVAEDEKVTVTVPVEATGEAVGVKTGGGVLEHVLFSIKLRGLPKDVPEVLALDVSGLGIGEAIHVGDIEPPPGVEVLADKQISVFAVAAPLTEVEGTAAEVAPEAAAAGEPEVIKEKKEEAPAEKK